MATATHAQPVDEPPLNPSSPTITCSFEQEDARSPPDMAKAVFQIEGMTCMVCVASIEQALPKASKGVALVKVSLLAERAEITFDTSYFMDATKQLADLIEDIGFGATHLSTVSVLRGIENGKKNDGVAVSRIDLAIFGMTCTVCSGTVEREVAKLVGVKSVIVNLSLERATIMFEAGVVGVRDIISRIEELGFDALVPDENVSVQIDALNKTRDIVEWRTAFFHCLIFSVPNFIIGMVIPMIADSITPSSDSSSTFLHDEVNNRSHMHRKLTILDTDVLPGLPLTHLIQIFLAIPVQFVIGRRFYVSAYKSVRHGSASMDVLVALGTSAAFFSSLFSVLYCMYMPTHPPATVFFDTSTMLITFITMGKYLENMAKGQTTSALTKLLSLKPMYATLLTVDPTTQMVISDRQIPSEHIQVNDVLRVLPGERVPTDGTIVTGTSNIDESFITGEPIPVAKAPGDSLIGGTVNGSGAFTMRATLVGTDTALSQIVKLVEGAQTSKAPIQRWADRVAGYFVPVVVALALFTFFSWLVVVKTHGGFPFSVFGFSADMDEVFVCVQICISVIVVACPCTLGLSVPTAVMVGTGVGAQHGILIKGGESLEKVHKINTVIFDKTGTLTEGKMTVTTYEIISKRDMLIHMPDSSQPVYLSDQLFFLIVGAAESFSEHPLARAVVAFSKDKLNGLTSFDLVSSITRFVSTTGGGISCLVNVHPLSDDSPKNLVQILPTVPITLSVHIGNLVFLTDHNITLPMDIQDQHDTLAAKGNTVIFVAINGSITAFLALGDILKPNAARVVKELKAMGLHVAMVTGDNRVTANVIAAQCGITDVYAGVSPSGKATIVKALQANQLDSIRHLDANNRFNSPTVTRSSSMTFNVENVDSIKNSISDHEQLLQSPARSKLPKSLSTTLSAIPIRLLTRTSTSSSISSIASDIPLAPRSGDNRYRMISDDITVLESGDSANMSRPFIRSMIPFSHHKPRPSAIAMIGDGINDSPALACADIGIALGTGTDIAMDAADLVIMKSSLLDLVVAIDLSHTIFRRIHINFFWAIFYNIVAIPLAMGLGLPWGVALHPMAAGFAMIFSSVSVVLSSLLLKWYRRPKWVIEAEQEQRNPVQVTDLPSSVSSPLLPTR